MGCLHCFLLISVAGGDLLFWNVSHVTFRFGGDFLWPVICLFVLYIFFPVFVVVVFPIINFAFVVLLFALQGR
jgi:hypothetical protein